MPTLSDSHFRRIGKLALGSGLALFATALAARALCPDFDLHRPVSIVFVILLSVGVALVGIVLAAFSGRTMNSRIERLVLQSLTTTDLQALQNWMYAYKAIGPATRQRARPFLLDILRNRELAKSVTQEHLCEVLTFEVANAWLFAALSEDYLRTVKDHLTECASDAQIHSLARMVRQRPRNANQVLVRNMFADIVATDAEKSTNNMKRDSLLRAATPTTESLVRSADGARDQHHNGVELLRPTEFDTDIKRSDPSTE